MTASVSDSLWSRFVAFAFRAKSFVIAYIGIFLFVFACNAKGFAIVIVFYFYDLNQIWMDCQKLFVNFFILVKPDAYDLIRTHWKMSLLSFCWFLLRMPVTSVNFNMRVKFKTPLNPKTAEGRRGGGGGSVWSFLWLLILS